MESVRAQIRRDNGTDMVKCPMCGWDQYGDYVPYQCPKCKVQFSNTDANAHISELEDAWEDRISAFRWP